MKAKKMEGITLVALVVTIVVLIILAGVTINAVIGDDGIIKKAQESANLTKESEAKEVINRAVIEYLATEEYDTLEDFLKTKVVNGTIDSVINNGDGTLDVSKNGYTVTVENKTHSSKGNGDGGNTGGETQTPEITVSGIKVVTDSQGEGTALAEESILRGNTLYITFSHSITGGTTTVSPNVPCAVTTNGTYQFTITGTVNGKNYTKEVSVTVNQFTDYKVGDYVNYTYDTADPYIVESQYSGGKQVANLGFDRDQSIEQTVGLKWRILNIDETAGTVDIVSEAPTEMDVFFYEILGYMNGPYFMNEICKAQYSNSNLGIEARNINLVDVEKQLTETGITARNAYAGDVQYGKTNTYTGQKIHYPSLYANQKGAGIGSASVTQPNISKDNFVPDPYEESKKIAPTEPTTDSSYSDASNGLTATQTYYKIDIDSSNYGMASEILKSNTPYWIASRYVDLTSINPQFWVRSISTSSDGYDDQLRNWFFKRLRPIASIKSNLFTGSKDSNGAWNLK